MVGSTRLSANRILKIECPHVRSRTLRLVQDDLSVSVAQFVCKCCQEASGPIVELHIVLSGGYVIGNFFQSAAPPRAGAETPTPIGHPHDHYRFFRCLKRINEWSQLRVAFVELDQWLILFGTRRNELKPPGVDVVHRVVRNIHVQIRLPTLPPNRILARPPPNPRVIISGPKGCPHSRVLAGNVRQCKQRHAAPAAAAARYSPKLVLARSALRASGGDARGAAPSNVLVLRSAATLRPPGRQNRDNACRLLTSEQRRSGRASPGGRTLCAARWLCNTQYGGRASQILRPKGAALGRFAAARRSSCILVSPALLAFAC